MKKLTEKGILFLLGGYDLEMVTIRDILLREGFIPVNPRNYRTTQKGFADKQLKWGASVLAYQEYFDYPGMIVGIELKEPPGWQPPPRYQAIDHHNKKSSSPSSIEQVAEKLHIPLSRWEQLVAANDAGYIPALKAMGASEEEIQEIRYRDRLAQGVTEKDEQLAEISLSRNLSVKQGVTIVKSLTDKFSPITDRLYGKTNSLLIYSDKSMVYYGAGIQRLVKHFSQLILTGDAFYRGNENGFFGIELNGKNPRPFLEEIIKIVSSTNTK